MREAILSRISSGWELPLMLQRLWNGEDPSLIFSNAFLGTIIATILGSLFYIVGSWRQSNRSGLKSTRIFDQQAVPVPGKKGVYKSGLLKNRKEETLDTVYPEVKTLYEAFLRGIEVSNNGNCLGTRKDKNSPYVFQNYVDIFKKSRDLGSAFVAHLGLQPKNTTNVGIYGKNCPEWFISALACVRFSMVTVPLYDTLGADAAKFVVQQTEIEVIVVDNADKIKKLLNNRKDMPTLKHIVVMNPDVVTTELKQQAKDVNIDLHKFYDLVAVGEKNVQEDVPPKPDDTYIICYTSGTTGTPKGVVLTHRNVVANISAFVTNKLELLPEMISTKQLIISYLPLSHMFEQVNHWCVLMFGGSIGYFRGDIQGLMDDLKALKPSIFPVVPRLLNRLNDTIQNKLAKSNWMVKSLFKMAYNRKQIMLHNRIVRNDTIWDKVVFKAIQNEVGGRVRYMITGSAPLNGEVLEMCRIALGAHIVEGYGQTEATAMSTITFPGEYIGGHCGGPSVCATIKLEDVPELSYFSSEGKGEILIKGPSITKGYYKDPEKTRELFDEEGFLHTGDIGQILPNGVLKVIDRKKHIFKLAQGEYVAPEKIENIYIRSNFVQHVYVDGDSLENFLVAIVVPEPGPLKHWFQEEHGREETLEKLCTNQEVIKHVLEDLHELGKENKLNSIEQVKAIYLEPKPFTIENGLLTPTLKAKRPQLRQKYKAVMAQLYKNSKK